MRSHDHTAASRLSPVTDSDDSVRERALPASPAGFEEEAGILGPKRADVPLECRDRAALIVLAIGRMCTPEEIVRGMPASARAAFRDRLERDEALAHVDLLLDALVPA
jgi:hypothetical protein